MTNLSTVNEAEKDKFESHHRDWWQKHGPLKTLHDINPTRLDFMKRHVVFHHQHVLDVGCGGGILSEAMAKSSAQVTGIDVSNQAISVARQHAKQSQLDIDYQCTPIETFEHRPVDIIACMEMLEHVDVPDVVIQHCARLLKPDGWLFLSTINRTANAYAQVILAAEYLLNLLPRQTHDYHKFIKPSELATSCRQYGFEIVEVCGLTYNPLTRTAGLKSSPSVNYLMACRKVA